MKDYIHRRLLKHCDAYLCYTQPIKERLSAITSPDKLFVATNTLDTHLLKSVREQLEREGREVVKRRLGMDRAHYLCFSGRLLASKQPHRVLDVLQLLRERDQKSVGVVFIGDGPETNDLMKRAAAYGLGTVLFAGAISDWKVSASYLFASDVLVNPGEVGLSVNHAFCLGLPVVTQEVGPGGPFHGPEAAFIKQGENGFFVAKDDFHQMAAYASAIFADRERWYSQTVAYAERELSVDKMIEGMCGAIAWVKRHSDPVNPDARLVS